MTKEDTSKKDDAEETTATETEETEKETEEKGEDESSSTKELDLDAEIEAEKQRGKPDPVRAREAFKKRHEKKEEEEEVDEDDKPLTRRELDEILRRERSTLVSETYSDRIAEIANELTDNPKEAELFVAMHKNRTFPEGLSLKGQLEEVAAVVYYKKERAKNGELTRALKAKGNISKESISAHQDAQVGNAPKMDATTTASYTRAGFKYDVKDRLWKKKLPNGNTLIKDPKTKLTSMVRKA